MLSRFRPNTMSGTGPAGTVVNLNRRPTVTVVGRKLQDDFADTCTDVGVLELYNR